LLGHMESGTRSAVTSERRHRLESLTDPFALRVPGRQQVERAAWLRRAARCLGRPRALAAAPVAFFKRVRRYLQKKALRALARVKLNAHSPPGRIQKGDAHRTSAGRSVKCD
jgi:hypothetical protein